MISAITWCQNRYPTYALVLKHCCDTITSICHITLIVTKTCVTENLRTQQLGNRTYCLFCLPTGHPDLTWDHQVPKTSMIWPCRHLKYCTVTSRCHSYVVILTASLFWYHRDTKSDLCHVPCDVSDLSDIPRGSVDTTHPNSDSQHRARSDSVRNCVPKEDAHPKYASLDRTRLKIRFARSRASKISFRDTSAFLKLHGS